MDEKKMLLEFLISEVQKHESTWNKLSNDYKNAFVKVNSWTDILENLRSAFPEEDCIRFKLNTIEGLKANWKNLRDSYLKRKKAIKGKSGAGLDDVDDKKGWTFFNSLRFLDQSNEYGKGVQGSSSFIDFQGTNLKKRETFLFCTEFDCKSKN